jgi:hypothetical protein
LILKHLRRKSALSEEIQTGLRVGALWHGAFPSKYWQHFKLLEVPADKVGTLKRRTIAKWMGDDDGSKTLVVPFSPDLSAGTLGASELEPIEQLLTIVQSSMVLFHTPSQFRPTRANIDRLKQMLRQMTERGMSVAWSADGLWSKEEQAAIAQDCQVKLVVDPLDEEFDEIPSGVARLYRVRGRRGFQSQLTDHELMIIHERVQGEMAYVSFGLSGFWADALRFTRVLQQQDDFWS